jgi:hypothetical protein
MQQSHCAFFLGKTAHPPISDSADANGIEAHTPQAAKRKFAGSSDSSQFHLTDECLFMCAAEKTWDAMRSKSLLLKKIF